MAKEVESVDSPVDGNELSGKQDHRIVEEYLTELKAIRSSGAGVPETSYYPALSALFNTVGRGLKPKVRCIMNINNQGAGLPDGGLFTAEQFPRQSDGKPKEGQLPSRGAIEAKGTKPDIKAIAFSTQVKDYLARYGIVIATNLRDFMIVARSPTGAPEPMEAFSLADSEQDFWTRVAAYPRGTAERKGDQFIEFIRRACLHNAPLNNPKDVAWFLASYARDALFRVEQKKELPALQSIRSALEEALGMKFTGEKGEHFFRSTLVQTLFYGVFSAWVRWHKDNPSPKASFDWRKAEWSLHVPFIRTLYEEVAKPSRLGPLALVEVLDWAAGVLNRVDRVQFFSRFEDEHAVQYFYEPFLEAYDPELRKELGVWYTPREIVKYQVARVDTVLREELNLPDGLADPNVIVLDPCCGTGAYLVEVLNSIAATLRDKGGDALVASDLKQAAMHRVFGFEIMPAPFVVSHLQLGLMLQTQGAPLSPKKGERVGVYLTNALTGWEPPKGVKATIAMYPDLAQERDAAEHVKRDKKIVVVLGNPPYNAFAGVSPDEEEGLVEAYKGIYRTRRNDNRGNPIVDPKTGKTKELIRYKLNDPVSMGGWGIKKFNLDDLYIRFFRLAERRIAEMSGKGVVSFISNFSYLGDPSFVAMRQRFLSEFDKLWLDSLNGDSRETGKLTPEGKSDPSVFSTDYNREGIRVGTAVCVIARTPTRLSKPTVRFRSFWGVTKRTDLLQSLNAQNINASYERADPRPENRFTFRPEEVAAHYTAWPKMVDLCEIAPSNGLMEKRGGALIDIDRKILEIRMRDYFDASLSWEEYKERQAALTEEAAGFSPEGARRKAILAESFDENRLRRYALRPFETRWCYYTAVNPLWNRARPKLWRQCFDGNAFVLSRMNSAKTPEGAPIYFCRGLSDDHMLAPDATCFALRLPVDSTEDGNALFSGKPRANLAKPVRAYLSELGIANPDADVKTAGLIWMHALAIGYSPAYLSENTDGIRRDWPRIPLPDSRAALEASATLGEQVAALLDTEAEVPGVTGGKIAPIFKTIGLIAKTGGGQLDPDVGDLNVDAGWGHAGKEGVTMPGKGRLTERPYDGNEAKAIEADAALLGITAKQATQLLGEKTCDVYLNGAAYWRNVPVNVWEYYIGGYQVIKKWLSYREHDLLGRSLKLEEAREVMNIARRIAAIILLQTKLDENYHKVKAATYDWNKSSKK
jgi:Type ISP C-terminal specificity domain/N-6 DNA Methylase